MSTRTSKRTSSIPEPADDWERCLLRQFPTVLPPAEIRTFRRKLRRIPSSALRCEVIHDTLGDQLECPPISDEVVLYDELVDMVTACRHREWGQGSRRNLISYLAQRFIPELAAFAQEDESED